MEAGHVGGLGCLETASWFLSLPVPHGCWHSFTALKSILEMCNLSAGCVVDSFAV